MKKSMKILIPTLILCICLVVLSACKGIPVPNIGGFADNTGGAASGAPSGTQAGTQAGTASGDPSDASTEPEVVQLTPQEVFVTGAKSYISTDTNSLLSAEQVESTLLGLPSEFWDDVNNSSNATSITASVGNIVMEGEASDESVNLQVDLKHNADTGDSSVEFSGGAGEDTNLSGGIYAKDGVGILKSPDTEQNVIKYTLPEHSDNSLTGTLGAMFTGVLSEDGTATDQSDSQEAREALAAELFDPWMADTTPDNYTDTTETWSLLGRDVECRVITMTMSGQAAYDFALQNFRIMNDDDQFSSMNDLFGIDPSSAVDDLQGEEDYQAPEEEESSTSATQQAIDELEAMTPEEIEALNFIVTTIFDGEEAIGLQFEMTSTDSSIKLKLLTYRKDLEYQVSVSFEDNTGSSFALDMSKVSSGGSTYDETMTLTATDEEGTQVMSGQYSGTVDETDTQLDMQGTFTADIQISLSEDEPQSITISCDITNSLSKTGTGYTGSGQADVVMESEDSPVSLTIWWKIAMEKTDVTVTLPMYTDSNVTEVTDLESLSGAVGFDYAEVESQSKPMQIITLLGSLMSTSGVTADIGF
jgi:hypothetical protein